ncbi:MAG: DUF4150 domain-containing protein [Planctomycetota bacterium]
MTQTVSANGLTISHKGTSGFEMCSAPDVCKTPVGNSVVPIPYTITSFSRDLVRGTSTVLADGGNSIDCKGSAHSKCIGDEAGTLKGVASSTNLHESTWITWSMNVYVEGKNVARLSDKMFMNNKNTVSGAGGHYEAPLSVADPILRELCKIFCEAREKWHKCKKAGGKCKRPSTLARDKVDSKLGRKGSKLNKAVKKKFPKGVGAAERSFFSSADKIFDGARKIYDKNGMKRAIDRQIKKLIKKGLIKKGAKMAAKSWMKLVPGLNVISTIYDVVDTAMMVNDIYGMVKSSDLLFEKAIKIQPDFAVMGDDGALEKIYDFKFDDPDSGYVDGWQKKPKQFEAYKKATGGKKPTKVDNETCKCSKGPKKPNLNLG